MRLLQNSGVPPCYLSRPQDVREGATFKNQIERFLDHRYGALHFLLPVLNGDDRTFFTNGDDEVLQRTWAREMGLPGKVSLGEILLAQIEAHRAEVFYNLDPVRYNSDFVHRLLRYARELTRTAMVAPATRAAIAGFFTEEQVVELTLVIAVANFTNRFNNGLEIMPEGQ